MLAGVFHTRRISSCETVTSPPAEAGSFYGSSRRHDAPGREPKLTGTLLQEAVGGQGGWAIHPPLESRGFLALICHCPTALVSARLVSARLVSARRRQANGDPPLSDGGVRRVPWALIHERQQEGIALAKWQGGLSWTCHLPRLKRGDAGARTRCSEHARDARSTHEMLGARTRCSEHARDARSTHEMLGARTRCSEHAHGTPSRSPPKGLPSPSSGP